MNLTTATLRLPRFGFTLVASLLAIASIALPARVFAAAAPDIQVVAGANQQAPYASAFPKPMVVWVYDPSTGRSLSGVRVNFSASPNLGLTSSTAVTDEHGLASVSARGLSIGTATLHVSIDGDREIATDFEGLAVSKAVITIVPADLKSNVGVVPAITDYTLRGFVDGDTEESAQISGTPVLTTTATSNSPDANYAIKGGVGTLSSPKYDFVPGFGTLVLRGTGNKAEAARIQALAAEEDPNTVRQAFTIPAVTNQRSNHGVTGENVQHAIQPPVLLSTEGSLGHLRTSVALPQVAASAAASGNRGSSENVRVAIQGSGSANSGAQAYRGSAVVRLGLNPPGSN